MGAQNFDFVYVATILSVNKDYYYYYKLP